MNSTVQAPTEKRFLNVYPELCNYMGISRKTAYDLANSSGFPSIRVGKRILIPVDALEQWVQSNAGKQA